MKKRVLPLLMASCMMATTISPVFGQEQSFDQVDNSTFAQETEQPTEETVVSVTIDGKTNDYSSWKDALEKTIKGNKIEVKLYQDVDFTNPGIYSKKVQTSGINLEIETQGADVTLDLNGHNVTNHFKNPYGNYPAKGFTAKLKKGGTFRIVNNAKNKSHFDVEKLGDLSSILNTDIITFIFGENITTTTKTLDLKHVVSKYSDFYLGMNGGFKALQEDGSYNFYTTASDAIGNSKDHRAILVNDYTGDDSFSASSGVKGTVDLNGNTFTTLSTALNFLHSNVDMTIQNGKIQAFNDNPSEDSPNVGLIGDPYQEVSNIKLTLKDVNIESNYYRGFDLHGTDKDLHLTLDHSTLTMTREDYYGIYMPAQESSVTLKNNSTIKAGTGIAVKGGTLNVENSHVLSHGQEFVPSTGAQSGFDETGDAIYVDGSYKFPISVNVKNSEVKSEHAKAMRDLFVAEDSKDTTIVAESGKFSSDVMKYVPDDKAALKVDSNYIIGTAQEVQKEVANANESVEILQGINSIQVPGGVKVENKTGDKVTVNGTEVGKGETITTPAPSTGGGGSTVKLNPVYRAYNPNNGEHLYTLDEKEYKHVASVGWDAEGVAFMAEEEKNGQALYRVYNPNSGLHHYTTDETEKNTLVSLGWHDEKVAWYTNKKPQSAPVYRVYNLNDGNHHYTMSKQEKDALVTLGWQFEGIAFRTAPIEK
ncbi:hypothetical protein [Allobaculum stercoricanis]|uniref:hypothetical protein n=1 Tax=Allobaculum stercoricanis TaxID=174709 RepID=UPI00036A07C6|nr:hypothetical protein [Allobaculum stercoricanis]